MGLLCLQTVTLCSLLFAMPPPMLLGPYTKKRKKKNVSLVSLCRNCAEESWQLIKLKSFWLWYSGLTPNKFKFMLVFILDRLLLSNIQSVIFAVHECPIITPFLHFNQLRLEWAHTLNVYFIGYKIAIFILQICFLIILNLLMHRYFDIKNKNWLHCSFQLERYWKILSCQLLIASWNTYLSAYLLKQIPVCLWYLMQVNGIHCRHNPAVQYLHYMQWNHPQ